MAWDLLTSSAHRVALSESCAAVGAADGDQLLRQRDAGGAESEQGDGQDQQIDVAGKDRKWDADDHGEDSTASAARRQANFGWTV